MRLQTLIDVWKIVTAGVPVVENVVAMPGAGAAKLELLLEMVKQWFEANKPDEPWEKIASLATKVASAVVAAMNKLGLFKTSK